MRYLQRLGLLTLVTFGAAGVTIAIRFGTAFAVMPFDFLIPSFSDLLSNAVWYGLQAAVLGSVAFRLWKLKLSWFYTFGIVAGAILSYGFGPME